MVGTEARTTIIAFSERYSVIAARLCTKEIFSAMLEASTTCPMALLRLSSALQMMVTMSPESAHFLVELNAISWISQIAHPGFLEYMFNSCPTLPEYALHICCGGMTGLYAPISFEAMDQAEAHSRISARIPYCRTEALDVLALIAETNALCCTSLLGNEQFQATFRYWSMSPIIHFEEDSAAIACVGVLVENFVMHASIVPILVEKFSVIDVIMQGLYLPAVWPVDSYLSSVQLLLESGGPQKQAILNNSSILESLFIIMFSTAEMLSDLAVDCIVNCLDSDGGAGIIAHMYNTGVITEAHLLSMKIHRSSKSGAYRIAELLMEPFDALYSLANAPRYNMHLSSTVYREEGNEYYRDKQYAAAVKSYTAAIYVAVLHSDFDEIHKAYGNRAQCHIQLGGFIDAVRDTSFSIYLESIDSSKDNLPNQLKLNQLARNLQRRANAFIKLGEPAAAASDLARAQAIAPGLEIAALQREAHVRCEEKFGWKIFCTSCRSARRWLKICPCRAAAYCSPACEKSGVKQHSEDSPGCRNVGAGKLFPPE